MKKILIPVIVLALAASAAFGQSRKKKMDNSLKGNWGGMHISMNVTDAGAELEFDCARATIKKKIVTKSGRFIALASFVRESGGPILRDSAPEPTDVVITGKVTGGTMTLSIKKKSDNEDYGSFTVRKGAEPELFKCR